MLALIDDPYKKRLGNENFIYDKINFKYDSETDSYTCPAGNRLDLVSTHSNEKTYKSNACSICPAKSECAKKASPRKIIRKKHDAFIEQNRAKLLTEDNLKNIKKGCIPLSQYLRT